MGSSSNRSGRLRVLSSLGEASLSSSSCFFVNTSCLSSSLDFLACVGEAMVLARLLLSAAGEFGGSYRVNDFVDNGEGLDFVALILDVVGDQGKQQLQLVARSWYCVVRLMAEESRRGR